MANYYERQSAGEDPFNWIKAHALMAAEAMEGYPFDHAGIGETSLLMALRPEGVDLSRLSEADWYARSARQASAAFGRRGRDLILARLRKILSGSAARDEAKPAGDG
jgi:creatinine amidohydrolase